MTGLRAQVRVAERNLDAALECGQGETIALIGPNGAGKSTLLHVVAGLLRPDAGQVEVFQDGAPVRWLDTEGGVDVAAHARRAALLLQQPTLFPHLSVRENVAFGARTAGADRRAAGRIALDWLDRVGVASFAARHPHELSGGQAARVAVARALAADPPVVLLDEPLAALDVDSAVQVRTILAEVLSAHTCVLVTHDVRDVAALSDRVVVLDGGVVVEAGPVSETLVTPRSRFAAAFVGRNVLSGRVLRGVFRSAGLSLAVDAAEGRARISFPPTAVRRSRHGVDLMVDRLESHGAYVRVVTGDLLADLPVLQAASLRAGDVVRLAVDPSQVTIAPSPHAST